MFSLNSVNKTEHPALETGIEISCRAKVARF